MPCAGPFSRSPKMPTPCKAAPKEAINNQNQIKLVITNLGRSEPHKSLKRGVDCVCS